MTRQEYSDHITKRHAEAAALSARKSKAYTGDGDPFDSFTVSAGAAGITPEQYLIAIMTMKLIRARSLLETGTVDFESIGDREQEAEDTMRPNYESPFKVRVPVEGPVSFLARHGYTTRRDFAKGVVGIYKDGELVDTLSGPELSVNNTPEKTVAIIKKKLNLQ